MIFFSNSTILYLGIELRNRMRLKNLLPILGFGLVLTACDPMDEFRGKPDTYIYKAGLDYLNSSRYDRAAKIFAEVDLQHPSSSLAPKSLLLIGYCHYANSDASSKNTDHYAEAIDAFESFLRIHASSPYAPYALYMIGLCNFEKMGDEYRDQSPAAPAINLFQKLIQRYPSSTYAKIAEKNIRLIKKYAALKQLVVARQLVHQLNNAAAIPRLKEALSIGLEDQEDKEEAHDLLRECYASFNIETK